MAILYGHSFFNNNPELNAYLHILSHTNPFNSVILRSKMKGVTTVRIHRELLDKLDGIKIHPRETYEELIYRLMVNFIESKKVMGNGKH